jgi:chorismate lyase
LRRHATRHAHWAEHANAVNPSRQMRGWLVDTMSLTMKLTARCEQFRIRKLRQGSAVALADEFAQVGLVRRHVVREREVVLQCDGKPVVHAHTVVPLTATASDWPFFGSLGEKSLGTTLFGDPKVVRGAMQFARLHAEHPLAVRAAVAVGLDALKFPLFARRCLYRRNKGALLVTEVFLPAIAQLPQKARGAREAASSIYTAQRRSNR